MPNGEGIIVNNILFIMLKDLKLQDGRLVTQIIFQI